MESRCSCLAGEDKGDKAGEGGADLAQDGVGDGGRAQVLAPILQVLLRRRTHLVQVIHV